MFDQLKPIPIYIKLFTDRIEITRLDTGETVSGSSSHKFSNSRLVVAHFENAQTLLVSLLEKWAIKKLIFRRGFYTVIQQMEQLEDGLSQIERRALAELAEFSGARQVTVIDHTRNLTIEKALSELDNNTNK